MSESQSILSFHLSFLTATPLQRNYLLTDLNKTKLSCEEGSSQEQASRCLTQESPSSELKQFHKEKKVFKCSFEGCPKSFEYKWILDRHVTSHFPFRLFKCEYEGCKKAYKSKENLHLHCKNKHMGVKPYQCRFCELKFSHRNGI